MSPARSGKRRSAIKLNIPKLVKCSNCKAPKVPHNVCPTCGTYRGRTVVAVKTKVKVTKTTKAEEGK
jgi:large subunit ribosomal protein L32